MIRYNAMLASSDGILTSMVSARVSDKYVASGGVM